jgi:hypothetical protein
MVEDLARSHAGADQPVESASPAQPVDFRVQAALDAYTKESKSCCDSSRNSSTQALSLNKLDFAPAKEKSLAAAFGDMLASAGYDKLFARGGENDPPSDRREDRKRQRDERREQRRENIKKLFDTLGGSDLTNLPNMLNKLEQAPEIIKGLQTLTQAVQGIESVKFNKTDDGKLGVTITRKDENQIDINKEQPGPPKTLVKNATIGKELSFKIGKDGDNIKLDDISGIKINSTVQLPKLLGGDKDVTVDLKSATLDKDKEGKQVIKATITNPVAPSTTIPVIVPLSLDKK